MTPVLDQTDIEQFRTIVARRFGLHYEDGKLDYLAEVARQRMELVGSAHFESYLKRLISSPGGSDEFRALAEQLTVNETFFFRNADNFRAFAGIVLPERIRAKTREKRLRILSAGCASGEEPYSLAVLVREALPDLENWDVKIIGIDINPAILAKATQARYSAWSLRATPEDARRIQRKNHHNIYRRQKMTSEQLRNDEMFIKRTNRCLTRILPQNGRYRRQESKPT
jgi:chemotaxis protein methyltransferase CheR